MIQKYKLDHHVIYHGDAVNILQESIADSSIDLIFSDPPYNIGRCQDSSAKKASFSAKTL